MEVTNPTIGRNNIQTPPPAYAASSFWEKEFGSEQKIVWTQFVTSLYKYLGHELPPIYLHSTWDSYKNSGCSVINRSLIPQAGYSKSDQIHYLCLMQLCLCFHSGEEKIDKETWDKICALFGKPERGDKNWLPHLYNFFKEHNSYFHGVVPFAEAPFDQKFPQGSFYLRFSNTMSAFVVTYLHAVGLEFHPRRGMKNLYGREIRELRLQRIEKSSDNEDLFSCQSEILRDNHSIPIDKCGTITQIINSLCLDKILSTSIPGPFKNWGNEIEDLNTNELPETQKVNEEDEEELPEADILKLKNSKTPAFKNSMEELLYVLFGEQQTVDAITFIRRLFAYAKMPLTEQDLKRCDFQINSYGAGRSGSQQIGSSEAGFLAELFLQLGLFERNDDRQFPRKGIENFFSIFQPRRDPQFLREIGNFIEETIDFFHGYKNSPERDLKNPGEFLLRPSSGNAALTLSLCNKDNEVKHTRLTRCSDENKAQPFEGSSKKRYATPRDFIDDFVQQGTIKTAIPDLLVHFWYTSAFPERDKARLAQKPRNYEFKKRS